MKRKIDWRRGSGSAIIGMVLLTVCFSLALIVMEHGNLFYRASRVQMLSDTIADGASVYAQTPLGLDAALLEDMATKIAAKNTQTNLTVTLRQPVISDNYSRPQYNDKIVDIRLDAETPALISTDRTGTVDISAGSKVRALSRLTSTAAITEEELRIIEQALGQLSPDSPRYKAILKSVSMMGWIYSQQQRWVAGYCDCSSFIISCFLGTEENYGVSGTCRTIMPIAMDNGWFRFWFIGYSDVDELQPGDVLYWRMQYAVDEGFPYGLGHVGMYLGNDKIIHASSTAGRVVITNLFGQDGGSDGRLIGYSRQG